MVVWLCGNDHSAIKGLSAPLEEYYRTQALFEWTILWLYTVLFMLSLVNIVSISEGRARICYGETA